MPLGYEPPADPKCRRRLRGRPALWLAAVIISGNTLGNAGLVTAEEDLNAAQGRFVEYCIGSGNYRRDDCECVVTRLEDKIERTRLMPAMLTAAFWLEQECFGKNSLHVEFRTLEDLAKAMMEPLNSEIMACAKAYTELRNDLFPSQTDLMTNFMPKTEILDAVSGCLAIDVIVSGVDVSHELCSGCHNEGLKQAPEAGTESKIED